MTGSRSSWAGPAAQTLVLAVGVALAAVALGPHRIGDYYTETDFYGGYAGGARLIQRGVLDPARYGVVGPVYELALAAMGFVTRELFTAAQALSILGAIAALWLWFALLRRRAGDCVALGTIAFLAANPTFFRYGYSATTDMFAFGIEAAAVYALLAPRNHWAPLAAGALCAVAALTRYSAIALLPAAVVCHVAGWTAGAGSRRRALALYLAGFVCVAGPWLAFALRSGQVPGGLLFHDVAYDIYSRAQGRTWADYQAGLEPGFRSLVDVLVRDPGAVVRRDWANLLSHAAGDASSLLGRPVAVVCVAGLVVAAVTGAWRRLVPLIAIGGLLYLALVPATYSERYSLVLAPCYLMFAGVLIDAAWQGAVARKRSGVALAVLVCVPFALSIRASVAEQRGVWESLPTEVLTVARALRERAGPGARVMALKSHIAYYSGAALVPMPATTSLAELADDCRREHVGQLYYSWLEANNRPSFWYLLDPAAEVPGLTRELVTRELPAVLYRVGPGFGIVPAWLGDDSARVRSEGRVLALARPAWVWRTRLSLAIAAFEQQRWREAFAHASEVTRLRPTDPLGWRLYGDAILRLGDRERAIAAFERVLALEPGDANTRIALGWLLLGAGHDDRAAAAWRPVAGSTSHRPTLERMVELFHAQGDATAERQAREALARLRR